MNDHGRPGPVTPGAAGAHVGSGEGAFWPTCDDVLDGAVLALVHGPVVFGLTLTQLCNQFLLLLPLLLGLDLNRWDIYTVHCLTRLITKLFIEKSTSDMFLSAQLR